MQESNFTRMRQYVVTSDKNYKHILVTGRHIEYETVQNAIVNIDPAFYTLVLLDCLAYAKCSLPRFDEEYMMGTGYPPSSVDIVYGFCNLILRNK